jgi:hypothetical protein
MSIQTLYENFYESAELEPIEETVGRGKFSDFPKSGRYGQTLPIKLPPVKSPQGRDRFYDMLRGLGIISPEMGSSYGPRRGQPGRKVYPLPDNKNVALVVVDRGIPELRTRRANDKVPSGIVSKVREAAGIELVPVPKPKPAPAPTRLEKPVEFAPRKAAAVTRGKRGRGRPSAMGKLLDYLETKPGVFTRVMKGSFAGEVAKAAGAKMASVRRDKSFRVAAGQFGDSLETILAGLRARAGR